MKHLMFDEEITTESINKLISQITDDVTIYFDSKGGSAIVAEYFIEFTKRTGHKIILVSNWGVKSCAFDIFFESKTKKVVMNSCFGIAHLVNRDINTTDLLKNTLLDQFLMKDIDDTNKKKVEFYKKLTMTEEQITKFINGEDVFVSPMEMRRMASRAEILSF